VRDEESYNKVYFQEYTGLELESAESGVMSMIRLAMSSVSFLSIFPMQDLLMLDSAARMNTPGTVGKNWEWRFEWQQVRPEIVSKISHYLTVYQR